MGMKTALLYLVVLTVVMGGALAYGFIVGDFWKDGGKLIENPWGIVSLFDVYVGFFFFIGWIAYRECCLGMTLTWELPSAWVEMWSLESTQFLPFIKVGEMPKPFSWV